MNKVGTYVLWMVLLVALCVALAWTVGWARRRFLRASDEEAGGGPAFTLAELRALHARGDLTDVEFEHVRDQLLKAQQAPLSDPRDAELLQRLRASREKREKREKRQERQERPNASDGADGA